MVLSLTQTSYDAKDKFTELLKRAHILSMIDEHKPFVQEILVLRFKGNILFPLIYFLFIIIIISIIKCSLKLI